MARSLLYPPPLPCNSDDGDKRQEYSDQSKSSSSSSSFTSQLSLPSVPSLTPHPGSTLEHAATSAAAAAHHHCLATLKGHSSYIFSLSVAGKHLYSGASNGEIRAWDRNPSSSTHSHNTVTEAHCSAVKSIAVLGEKLITAHQDHKIRIYKIHNNQKYRLITTLPTVTDGCMRLFSAKNYVETRRHVKRTWVHHADAVSSLALSENGSLLYSVSWDRSIKVWRTSDFKCVESLHNAHEDAINAVVLSSDGHVYTASADKTIKVWKKQDGTKKVKHALVCTLEKHSSSVNALALSGGDAPVLYSGACDRSIIVWEKGGGAAGWAVAGALRGHKKAILCLGVVSDLVCSGSADKTVRVWRRGCGNSYSCLAVLEGHNSPVKCLTAASDNNFNYHKNNNINNCCQNSYLVYSGGLDFDIKVWQIRVSSS
ncbi:hypothetical protein ACP275_05G013600 [Erythranthe tilingii]